MYLVRTEATMKIRKPGIEDDKDTVSNQALHFGAFRHHHSQCSDSACRSQHRPVDTGYEPDVFRHRQ